MWQQKLVYYRKFSGEQVDLNKDALRRSFHFVLYPRFIHYCFFILPFQNCYLQNQILKLLTLYNCIISTFSFVVIVFVQLPAVMYKYWKEIHLIQINGSINLFTNLCCCICKELSSAFGFRKDFILLVSGKQLLCTRRWWLWQWW